MDQSSNVDKSAIHIIRVFDAPRDLVWKAWTEPALVMRWWGPAGYTSPFCAIDLRVGGKYLYAMRSPEGQDFWSTGVFHEIVPMERIITTDSFSDEQGNIVPASYYGMSGDWVPEAPVTITFEGENGRTRLTLRYEGIPPGQMSDQATAGWNESLDKLAGVLEEEKLSRAKTTLVAEPGRQEASMIRIFDAPPERVFRAYTDPELIPRWWAPRRFTISVETMEVKPGGIWRILNRDVDGAEFAFHGVYHEVSPARIVSTFEFEGMPGHVLLEIASLEDVGGRTRLTVKSVFESVEDRDGMLKSGMEDGGLETMDRLAELVENG
ncbi:SRPBCC domain-containing protein [Methanosphaerula subterraneus]|uniref:SRPBCC domain-containing protein n=1 Tax=Methanosphaerula subterraneus TaxID=3350244 RepID=UPI003F85215D